ncbi:MAG: thiamine-phosphate kinase [Thermodesulfobacteriota bacterium]
MLPHNLNNCLKFYFITDDGADLPVIDQVKAAILGGATIVQYRHKSFTTALFDEAAAVRSMCRANRIPFIINDNILLAKALEADGVHVGQDDESPADARRIMGPNAIIGVSVSTLAELEKTDTGPCDYIGAGPVFATSTKKDVKPTIGPDGLARVVKAADIPVVAIGGIDAANAGSCFEAGAVGVAVISCVTRSAQPVESARQLAVACGIFAFPDTLLTPWNDEFGLIRAITTDAPLTRGGQPVFDVSPGDDAAVLKDIRRPVISTDAHVQGVHFDLAWQTPEEVGYKAVVVTLSDLAASYARPVAMFVNLTLPPDVSESLAIEICAGLKKALREYDCTLGGGNVTSGRDIYLNLFVIGELLTSRYPSRSNAKINDGLYCTGPLGLARAGLMMLQKKDDALPGLIERFKFPRARFDAAAILAAHDVACVIDVSDGLAGDAAHLAEASRVTLTFDFDDAVYSPDLLTFCKRFGQSPEEMVLRGGEDYELLFTCDPAKFDAIHKQLPEACRVGWCREFDGQYLKGLPHGLRSFQHGEK